MNHAMGSGRLTDTDHARIEELAEKGLSSGQIAQRLRRHQSTVQWFMYRNGLVAPKPMPEGRQVTYMRNGRTVTRYTQEEDAFIQALRLQGLDIAEIAELSSKRFNIDRKHHSVRCRLIMLGAREDEA